jgi:hypothetical protein
MAEPIRLRRLQVFLAATLHIGGSILLQACQPGSEITEYQAPAQILRTFRAEHPEAQAVSYRQSTKDGFKVYLVQYLDGEEEKEAWYNVQGKPFVSKAERRVAEQERVKQQEETEAKAKEDAEEKASQGGEITPEHRVQKTVPKTISSPVTNQTVP